MGRNPTGTPAPVDAAELSQVISFMAEDKSNDWSDEIKTLESIETELAALRDENETFRANIGGIDTIVLQSRYARLGRYLAISLGANEEWDNDSIAEGAAELWKRMGGEHPLGDQDDAALKHWRALADRFGIEHDGEAEDEDDDDLDDASEEEPADVQVVDDAPVDAPKVIATIQPQAWHRNQAIDAGDTFEADVTIEVAALCDEQRDALTDNSNESDELYLSAVKAGRAKRWDGPFYVDVRDAIDEAYAETCREESCTNRLDDGEGYDGLCGEHADEAEAAGECDGE
jgi:hypothetical protein